MATPRASIFEATEEPPDAPPAPAPAGLDLSGFAPRAAPDPQAPPAAAVRAVAEAARFRSREPVAPNVAAPALAAPSRPPRRYRTGRNVQFNVKVSQATVEAFYAIADRQGWVLGETLEHALAALRRELGPPAAMDAIADGG